MGGAQWVSPTSPSGSHPSVGGKRMLGRVSLRDVGDNWSEGVRPRQSAAEPPTTPSCLYGERAWGRVPPGLPSPLLVNVPWALQPRLTTPTDPGGGYSWAH